MRDFIKREFDVEKIVFACYVAKGTGASIHNNRPSHGLAFHLSGDKDYYFSDGKKITTKANSIIYLPKGSSYAVKAKEPGDCYAINFDIDDESSFSSFVIACKNTRVLDFFKVAQRVWTSKKPGYNYKCKAALYEILYIMQEEYLSAYTPANKYEIIRPAVEYIHRYYPEKLLNISELSAMCGITSEYFRRLFHRFYGVSPIKYINNLKITRAKELLLSQMYTVSEAAAQAGYTDMSHFSREFKKHTGMSPTVFMDM